MRLKGWGLWCTLSCRPKRLKNNHNPEDNVAPKADEKSRGTESGTPTRIQLAQVGRTKIEAVFDEPELSSDGGALIIREAAKVNGVIEAFADAIKDNRSQAHVEHSYRDLIMQRVTQISLGYEDANDCDTMRKDWAIKVATDRIAPDDDLGSQPTMSRLENSVTQRDLVRLFYALIDNFLDSYSAPPEQMVLDLDPPPAKPTDSKNWHSTTRITEVTA
jgi:hypothetical protein